jgi:hypothetical protein
MHKMVSFTSAQPMSNTLSLLPCAGTSAQQAVVDQVPDWEQLASLMRQLVAGQQQMLVRVQYLP